MKRYKQYIQAGVIVLFNAVYGYGQQTDLRKEQQLEELVESMNDSGESDSGSTLLLDELSDLAVQSVYVNRATEEELRRFNLFNIQQINHLLNYRKKYGEILTIHELAASGIFNEQQLERITPFLNFSIEPDSLQRKITNDVHQTFLARMKTTFPVAAGYTSSKTTTPVYPGLPFGYYARYRAEVGKWLALGLTAENDAGEPFFSGTNKAGFDFLSGFIAWNGKGVVRKMVAGDYHLRIGQGVSLWSGGGVGYASDLSSWMRSGDGIRPYSSTDENQFFRGAAIQLALQRLQLSLFYSGKKRDANLDGDSISGYQITSFRTDGFHRTLLEQSAEKNAGDKLLGAYADFRYSTWRFGFLVTSQTFGLPVTKGTALYKAKTFEGKSNVNFGMDYHWISNQVSFFGEVGVSENLKPAMLHGMLWKAHPQFSVSMLYRYYHPAFQTFHAGAFAEGSGGRNEEGLFTAVEYFPVSRLKISGQADLFYFPWMTYQTISPARGVVMAWQAEYKFNADLLIYAQTRFVCKPQKMSDHTGVPAQWDESTTKWRIHGDWRINERIQMRSRFEAVTYAYRGNREYGFLFFQDIVYAATSGKLKTWFRIACYDTDGYNSRVICYENDLLYYYAIPEFHGKGIRTYLNIKWQPIRMVTLYLKSGYTLRQGAIVMGSGYDATPGNYRIDLRGQLCLKF